MNAERVGSLFWMTFGGATVYSSFELGLGEMGQPGSGFLAFVAGCFVGLMAMIVFVQSFRTDQVSVMHLSQLWQGLKWQRAVAITIMITIFIAVFETLGFFICSFVLLSSIMRWLEGLSWKTSLLVPAVTIVITFVLFKTVLKISLPAGIFGF
jgi:hypothetical protein